MAVKVKFITEGVDAVESGAKKVAGALGDVAKIAGGFVVSNWLMKAPAVLMDLTSASRDLELQQKKANIVFGDQIGIVEEWADANAKGMGLTNREATSLAAGMADLLIPMGMSREAAAKMSTETLSLSGALAEWSGGQKSSAEVSDVLTKAYLGETDGLKALGISINAAEVKQKALSMGLVKSTVDSDALLRATLAGEKAQAQYNEAVKKHGENSLQAREADAAIIAASAAVEEAQRGVTGEVDQQSAALAIQELIMEKSTDAQTAFANGADSAARKQAEMNATVSQAKEDLAVAMGPAIAFVTTKLAELVPVVIEGARVFAEEMKPKVMEFVDAAVPVLQFIGKVVAEEFAKFQAYYQSDIKPALDNIIAGVSAVIGFIVDHWPEIWRVIGPIMDMIRVHIETVVGVIREIFQILMDLIGGDFSGAWQNLKELIALVWDGIKETISLAIEAVMELMKQLGPLMLEALGNMKDLLYEAGKDIIRGLIRGIGDMKDAALGAIGDVAGGIKDKALGAFKINSPSLVFADIGAGLMEGLEKGIFDEQDRPLNAMDKLAIGLRQAMDKLTSNEAGGGGPEAGLKRMTQALLDAGYTMEEIEPNAKKLFDTLSAVTNEAGDGAMSYEDAMKSLFDTLNSLLATPAGEVIKAAAKPSGKENSSANASGGSLLGIGNAPKLGDSLAVSNQGSAAQTKAAKEAEARERTERWQERVLSVLLDLLNLAKQGQSPAFGNGL